MNAGDLKDREEHLEQLLRSTFAARAQRVQDGPSWSGVSSKRYAGAFAAAAAIIAMLTLAAGFALYQGRSDDPTDAAGPTGAGKRVPLPRAWHQAVTEAPVRVDGKPAVVEAITPSGVMIATVAVGVRTRVVAIEDGKPRTLYRVPSGRRAVGISTDGKHVVLATQRDDPQTTSDTTASTILTIDLDAAAGRGVRDISTGVPPDGAVAIGTPELLKGVVYYIASPADEVRAALPRRLGRGRTAPYGINPPKHGVVVTATISTGRYHVVGKANRFETNHDPRGVFWTGGNRRADDVPRGVRPYREFNDGQQRIARTGDIWACDVTGDGRTVRWVEGSTVRSWRVGPAAHTPDGRGTLGEVAGPYVFLAPSDGVNPHVYVLDTRTGAYADLGIKADSIRYDDAFRASGTTVAITVDGDPDEDVERPESIVLDLSTLPGLQR